MQEDTTPQHQLVRSDDGRRLECLNCIEPDAESCPGNRFLSDEERAARARGLTGTSSPPPEPLHETGMTHDPKSASVQVPLDRERDAPEPQVPLGTGDPRLSDVDPDAPRLRHPSDPMTAEQLAAEDANRRRSAEADEPPR